MNIPTYHSIVLLIALTGAGCMSHTPLVSQEFCILNDDILYPRPDKPEAYSLFFDVSSVGPTQNINALLQKELEEMGMVFPRGSWVTLDTNGPAIMLYNTSKQGEYLLFLLNPICGDERIIERK